MKVKIVVNMNNAAFYDDPKEISRILSEAGERLSEEIGDAIDDTNCDPGVELTIRDINGNKVGLAKVTK